MDGVSKLYGFIFSFVIVLPKIKLSAMTLDMEYGTGLKVLDIFNIQLFLHQGSSKRMGYFMRAVRA